MSNKTFSSLCCPSLIFYTHPIWWFIGIWQECSHAQYLHFSSFLTALSFYRNEINFQPLWKEWYTVLPRWVNLSAEWTVFRESEQGWRKETWKKWKKLSILWLPEFFFLTAVMYTMIKNNWGGKGLLSACSGSPLLRAGQELKAEAEDMEEHCLWAALSCFLLLPWATY